MNNNPQTSSPELQKVSTSHRSGRIASFTTESWRLVILHCQTIRPDKKDGMGNDTLYLNGVTRFGINSEMPKKRLPDSEYLFFMNCVFCTCYVAVSPSYIYSSPIADVLSGRSTTALKFLFSTAQKASIPLKVERLRGVPF